MCKSPSLKPLGLPWLDPCPSPPRGETASVPRAGSSPNAYNTTSPKLSGPGLQIKHTGPGHLKYTDGDRHFILPYSLLIALSLTYIFPTWPTSLQSTDQACTLLRAQRHGGMPNTRPGTKESHRMGPVPLEDRRHPFPPVHVLRPGLECHKP